MSTNNICFCGEIRKILRVLGLIMPYLELCSMKVYDGK